MVEKKIFSLPIRIYYEDTDAGGVVYYARYLHFFERARTELLRSIGFSQQSILKEQNQIFVVKSVSIDYVYPAKLDDFMNVETSLESVKSASLLFVQSLKKEGIVFCRATTKVACVDFGSMKPAAISKEIKSLLMNNCV